MQIIMKDIFNCQVYNSILNLETLEDVTLKETINKEFLEHHNQNNLQIDMKQGNVPNQKIINNKLILKSGYYFCSYLYKHKIDKTIYIYCSKPMYEYKENPFCISNNLEGKYTNIIIKDKVPTNSNIIGVMYFYTYLSDKSKCKSRYNIEQEKTEILDNDKHLIDVVFYNAIYDKIFYNLNYIFYKKINFEALSFKNISYT